MKRRTFSRIIGSAAILLAGGARQLAAAPQRILRAIAAHTFPGRLRSFDPAAVKRPGKWSG